MSTWYQTGKKLDEMHTAKIRASLRAQFNVSVHVPVIESADVATVELTGRRGGWFTRGGTRIHSPSAYSRRGWSNMTYRRSSLRLIVPIGTLSGNR